LTSLGNHPHHQLETDETIQDLMIQGIAIKKIRFHFDHICVKMGFFVYYVSLREYLNALICLIPLVF